MPELRFIIADGLPERELDYLKQNIRPEPDLKLVVTGKNNANRRAEFSLFPPEESVLISTDGHIISNMDQLGMATLGYIGPGGAENESTGEVPDDVITEIGSQNVNCSDSTDEVTEGIEEQGMQAAVMLIEGLEEVDETFLLRAYERKHGIPWTIVTTERCIVREITLDDLYDVWARTKVKPEPAVTFIQADSFYKVISLVERLNENPMTGGEIAQLFGFKERQSDYYFNACRYLGLAEKQTDEDGVKVHITAIGRRLLKLPYRARQLEYVRLILEHPIFHDLFEAALQIGDVPDKEYVAKKMREYQVCGENLIVRRSSSVRAWLYWILTLVNEG